MSIKVVLFDLDGTLLPMDQEVFTKTYFKGLAAKLAPYGYEPEMLIKAIWSGVMAMVKNNGEKNNEAVFWDSFCAIYGEKVFEDISHFDDYYKNDFQNVQSVCGFNPKSADTVRALKNAGMRVVLATNPLFPAIATESRIRWAGLKPEDFELYTTYESSCFCKPNPEYYREILMRIGVLPEECLMVGNDVSEDMVAQKIGMKVFLLTDCLINKNNEDISVYPNGDFSDLLDYVNSIQK